MALSFDGREEWPPGLVTSRRKFCETFSEASTVWTKGLPLASSWPPAPSLSAKAASIRSRLFLARYSAPLNAPLVSSPQVSASFKVWRGL